MFMHAQGVYRRLGTPFFVVAFFATLNYASNSYGGNANDTDALFMAVSKEVIDEVSRLVGQGAKVKAKDEEKRTPLHYAAESGQIAMAEFLLTKGAKVNAKDKYGMTPLYMATKNGYIDLCQTLIDNGAKVKVKTKSQLTPLHEAATWVTPISQSCL